MSKGEAASVEGGRAIKAAALVLALLLSIPGVEALMKVAHSPSAQVMGAWGLDAHALVQAGDPFEALDRIEDLSVAGGAEVPEAFAREVGFLPGAQDIRADGTGAVVGYIVAGELPDVRSALDERMGSLGWRGVSLGGVEGATYVKEGGELAWVLMTCTQVGRMTSVTARCM